MKCLDLFGDSPESEYQVEALCVQVDLLRSMNGVRRERRPKNKFTFTIAVILMFRRHDGADTMLHDSPKHQKTSTRAHGHSSLAEVPPAKPNFHMKFQFFDGLKSKEQRSRIRSHTTAQYYRRKRFEDYQRSVKTQSPNHAPPTAQETKTLAPAHSPTDETSSHRAKQWLEPTHVHDIEVPIMFLLDSSRQDPFNSYPIEASRDVDELVDHFCYVIPSLVYKHWSRAIRRPRSCWELYNLYRKDPVSFIAMLHHSAVHLATLRRYKETLQTIRFKQQALEAINARLKTAQSPYDDGTIVAVGLLANGERLWGNSQIAQMHWSALKRMLAQRGGFAGFRDNPAMHTKLLWSFIAMTWPTPEENPSHVDSFSDEVGSVPEFAEVPSSARFRMSCDEFTQLVDQRKQQALVHMRRPHEQTMLDRSIRRIRPALEVFDTGYLHPDKVQAVENCRMACLIFLNLVLADHDISSATSEKYFEQLLRTIEGEDDDSTMTAEHLLWTLLATATLSDHYDRCWKLSRLIGVVKQVGVGTRHRVDRIFRILLLESTQSQNVSAGFQSWDGRAFVEEAIAAPLDQDERHAFGKSTASPCLPGCRICDLKP